MIHCKNLPSDSEKCSNSMQYAVILFNAILISHDAHIDFPKNKRWKFRCLYFSNTCKTNRQTWLYTSPTCWTEMTFLTAGKHKAPPKINNQWQGLKWVVNCVRAIEQLPPSMCNWTVTTQYVLITVLQEKRGNGASLAWLVFWKLRPVVNILSRNILLDLRNHSSTLWVSTHPVHSYI